MKKRLFAIVTVIVFSFSAFCVVASATGSLVPELLFEVFKYAYESGDFGILFGGATIETSYNDLSPEQIQEVLSNYNQSLQAQKEKANEAPESVLYQPSFTITAKNGNVGYFDYSRSSVVNYVSQSKGIDISDYYIYCDASLIHSVPADLRRNLGQVYVYAVPAHFKDHFNVYHDETTNKWRITTNGQRYPYFYFGFTVMYSGSSPNYTVDYFDDFQNGQTLNHSVSGADTFCCFNDFGLDDEELKFRSEISVTGSGSACQLNIFLDSNKPVLDEMFAFGGILYDDGSERYDGTDRGFINGDYVNAKSLQGGQHWEWQYDIDEFSNWAYRKRILDLDCFYGFVAVYNDDECIYSNESKLALSDPNDIFDDVTPLPPWSDYAPTIPDLPTFTPVTFDYSSGDTFYNISNYGGNDFDFASFFGWFNGAFVAMANNMAAFFANAEAFFNAVAEFSLDGIIDAFGYIGDLIGDLQASINGNFDSFAQYFGDLETCLDHNMQMLFDNLRKDTINNFGDVNGYITDMSSTINGNLETIIDNLKQIAENQLVPDKVYIDWLLQHAMPWYGQIRNALDSHTFETDSLSLTVDFGEVLGEYSFNFTNATMANKIRDILTMVLYASTVVGCGRIGFQILGIDISKGKGGEE